MSYDRKKHHRRSIRLPDHDYRAPGAYFITTCTYEGEPLFGEVVDGEMRLSEWGQAVSHYWMQIPEHSANVELDAWVVMPNHLHAILVITAPTAPNECPPRIIGGDCTFVQISRDEAHQPHAWHTRHPGLAAQLLRTHRPQRRGVGTNPQIHTEQPDPLVRGPAASSCAAQPVPSRQAFGRGTRRPMTA